MAMENGDATPQGTPTRDGNNTDVRVSLDGSARLSSGKKMGLVKDQLTLVEARGPKGEPKYEVRDGFPSAASREARRHTRATRRRVSRLDEKRQPTFLPPAIPTIR